jgi:signal transduction histidine kinase
MTDRAGTGDLPPRGPAPDPPAPADLAALEARARELQARVVALEAERRRVFEDAQREADAVFAQYQLSQLLAAGGSVDEIATAVLAEVARASGAAGAALWLAGPGRPALQLVAMFPGDEDDPVGPGWTAVPRHFADAAAAGRWARAGAWSGVALPEGRALGGGSPPSGGTGAVGYLAVRADPSRRLDPDHERYLGSVRLELSVTLRAAQLRASLVGEQATLAAILEGATDAIVAVDRGRRLVRLNAAAAALVGTSAESGTGMMCSEFLGCARPQDDGAGIAETATDAPSADLLCGPRCPFGEVLEGGPPIVGREIAVRRRDGGPIPVAASVSRMEIPEGGAVAILRDLRAARALDDAKTSFVAAVSHELRTPLALIDGYTQSLLHLDLDRPTARRHLERIVDAARRLAALVDEIIDISQLESDALVLRRTPVAIDGLLRAYVAERAEGLDARAVGLTLTRALPQVDVDATRIRQVIANLVQNAEKHAGPRAPIEIRARRSGHDTVVVTVVDGGRGIAREDRDHVFERFYRGQRVRASQVQGSGLGLYLCRRIVEAHGGWIRLDATTRGTSISVGLPVAPMGGGATDPEASR